MPVPITVLVVKDEALLRMNTVDAMIDQGLEVMEAANASEALEMFRSGRRFECLFNNVDMPGDRDDLELAEVVKAAWPPIDIIVTSGHRNVLQCDMHVDGVFIGKPYSLEAVGDPIRRLNRKA